MNHPLPVLGFRRDGRPIRLVAGAAPDHVDVLNRSLDGMTGGAPGESPLTIVQRNYDTVMNARALFLDSVIGQKRAMHASEQRLWDKSNVERAELEARLNELKEQETREAASAGARTLTGGGVQTGGAHTSSQIYHRGSDSASFFRDLRAARMGDWEAIDRLGRNQRQAVAENRALGNTGNVGGSGSEFAPPGWFVADFIELARAARVTANLLHHEDLPRGVSSVNLPKVTTGTTTAVQTTQNTALSQTDMTTSAVSSGIVTIGGKQVLSLQLIEQSPIPFDRVVLGDLASDYARQLDLQVISGTGAAGQLRGLLAVTGLTNVVYTSATPVVTGAGGLYQKMAQLGQAVQTSRFMPITAWILHPRRWAWIASAFDSQGRPLVVPSGAGFNVIGTADQMVAQGKAGEIFGVPVYLDPNLPTNQGAAANQDVILGLRADDAWLWESPLAAEAFDAPYADSLGLLCRVYAHSALVPDRYPTAVGTITGSGLTPPTFS